MKSLLFFILSIYLIILVPSCNQEKKDPANLTPEITNLNYKESMLLTKTNIEVPVADKIEKQLTIHGDTRIDNYYWMKLSDEQKNASIPDSQTTKVLNYLNAENTYREKMMAHTEGFQKKLFEEIKGRIKQTDMSVPFKKNGYYYITRYEEGKEYPIHSRKKESPEAAEEIMLNVNDLAKDYEYFAIAAMSVSSNNKILAYCEDTVSRRQYNIRFKNLSTGKMFTDVIPNTSGNITWANDNKTLFYSLNDAALRSYKILRHTIGTSTKEDVLVFHEKDETFDTFIFKTKSEKYLVLASSATLSNEYKVIEANNPTGNFKMFQPRENKLEYSIDHYGDNWYILTNKDEAENFKIMTCGLESTTKENWKELIPHRKDVLIEDIDLFKTNMVISERVDGITKIKIRPWQGKEYYVDFDEEDYNARTSVNPDFDSPTLRLEYTSLTTPNTTFDYDLQSKKLILLKQQEVIGDFNSKDYVSERVYAAAKDGTKIPISIVYKKGFVKDGTRPLLLYGYGSYGISIDPYFSSVRLSLLDRGFAFAIAHIRGGQEMGRQWYEDGKFLKKKNTFTDFIDCAEHLVKEKFASKDKLFADGRSAGGLLMGAVLNMRPDLWSGVIAAVPFVDVVTTMLDETIPLTTGEYSEWGNPSEKEYYDYMKSYSPYDNVMPKSYPSMLIITGYHDSQVQYWEPAKWVAKLRELKTDKNPLLMYCNMDTGHGGASGRFKQYLDDAMEYAFLLDLAGLVDAE
jgi:oligopeptidase B